MKKAFNMDKEINRIINSYYIYNQSTDFKTIDVFNKHQKHTGRVDLIDKPKGLADSFHKSRSGYLEKIIISSTHNLPLFNALTIIENGKSKKVMPMYYLSPYQNLSTIMQITVNRKVKDFNILFPLTHDNNARISLNWIKDEDVKNIKVVDNSVIQIIENTNGKRRCKKIKKMPFTYDSNMPCPEKQLCFVVNNTYQSNIKVDLLALLAGKKYDGVEFDSPISDISKINKFNRLKVVSMNTSQVVQVLTFKSKDKDNTSNGIYYNIASYITPYQNFLWLVGVENEFIFSDKDSLSVNILGNTKCMYYFYK